MSMKNSNDTIGNRTRDLPTCSAVPQPTAPPRALQDVKWGDNIKTDFKNKTGWRPLYLSGSGNIPVPALCEHGFETSGGKF